MGVHSSYSVDSVQVLPISNEIHVPARDHVILDVNAPVEAPYVIWEKRIGSISNTLRDQGITKTESEKVWVRNND